MILKSLRLKNFKCYENFQQDFELGITSICGENGAGKSSLLEAISWALFNFLPYSSNSRIIRNGAKNAEVELTLQSSLDGNEYLIKRKTQGASNVFNVSKKFIVAEGVTNIQDWVKHELGLRPSDNLSSICRNGIATPQGSLTIDFSETPEARRKIFDVMLGLDEYKTVQVALTDCLKLVNEKLIGLKIDLAASQSVDEEIEKLNTNSREKNNELQIIEKEIHSAKISLDELIQEIQNAQKNKSDYQQALKDLKQFTEQKQELESALAELEKQLTEKNGLEGEANQYEKLKEDRKSLQAAKTELEIQKNLQAQFSEALKIEKENFIKAKQQVEQLSDLKAEFEKIKVQAETYENLLKQEKDLNKSKVQMEAELLQKDKLTNELLESEKLKLELLASISEAESKKDEVAKLAEFEETLEKLRLECHEVLKLEKEKSTLLTNPSLSLNSSQEAVNFLQSINTKNSQILELEGKKNQLKAQAELNRDLIPKLADSGVCPILLEPCLNLKAKEAALEGQNFLEKQKEDLQTTIDALEAQIETLQKDLVELKRLHEQLEELNKIEKQLANRTSKELIERGQALKAQVEVFRTYKNKLAALPDFQNRLSNAEKKIIASKTLLSELVEKEKELPLITQKLLELSKEVASIKTIAQRALILRSELEKEKVIMSLVEESQQKINSLESNLKIVEEKIQKYFTIPESLIALEAQLEKLEPLFIKWSQLKLQVEKIPELKTQLYNLSQQVSALSQLAQTLEMQQHPDSWFDEKTELLKTKQEDFNQKEGLRHSIKYLLKEWTSRLQELKDKQVIFKQQQERVRDLKLQEENVSKMRLLFKELSIQMAKQYTEKIGKKATALFREIMQDASYELIWSEDYEIVMYKNGQKLPFELLSGGQQTAAAIAIRLGLLQELSNIRFAFFDEPTAHLDTERRNQLALQISGIKSFNQLFVITHDESFASQANNIIQI